MTPVPKKKKRIFRRIVFYTSAATATFYVASAFVSFKVPQYHDLFVENVPLGAAFIRYTKENEWDTLTVAKVIDFSKDSYAYLRKIATREQAEAAVERTKEKTKEVLDKTKEASKTAAHNVLEGSKDKLKSAVQSLKTSVEKSESEIYDKGAKAAAIARHRSVQFSEGVEDLVRQAEAALSGKPVESVPDVTTTPAQPEVPAESVTVAEPVKEEEPAPETPKERGKNVYDVPLPIGFEPPPGYSRPAPPKPPPKPVKEEPPIPPLPLVAPAVVEFAASEPVISQLASVIDNLASFLNSNPSAADKARDILDGAKGDLTQLATRIEAVKEEERQKLEASLDEQTHAFTIKLLELEMEAQDKLDNQEDDFRKYFEEEKAKFVAAYREKLNRELQTQSEIINER